MTATPSTPTTPPTPAAARTAATATRSPLVAAIVARGGVELRQYFRSRDAVVFTLALPVVMLALLGSVFSGRVGSTGVSFSQVYTAGLLAGGLASTSFLNLGVAIANERDTGALKRLAGTPMPPVAYFAGKVIVVLVTSVMEIVAMLAVGHLAYGVDLPATPGRWWTFMWVTLLGGTSMALIGVAASSLPRSARSAAPVLNLPFLVLEFLSGVFVPFTVLSPGLYSLAGAFPLRWIAEGYRSALLPSGFAHVEAGHTWNYALMAAVPAIWCVAALAVSARTFRWTDRGE